MLVGRRGLRRQSAAPDVSPVGVSMVGSFPEHVEVWVHLNAAYAGPRAPMRMETRLRPGRCWPGPAPCAVSRAYQWPLICDLLARPGAHPRRLARQRPQAAPTRAAIDGFDPMVQPGPIGDGGAGGLLVIPNPFFILPISALVKRGFASVDGIASAFERAKSGQAPHSWFNPLILRELHYMGWDGAEAAGRLCLFYEFNESAGAIMDGPGENPPSP